MTDEDYIMDWIFNNVDVPGIGKGDGIEQMHYGDGYYEGYRKALSEERIKEIIIEQKLKYEREIPSTN